MTLIQTIVHRLYLDLLSLPLPGRRRSTISIRSDVPIGSDVSTGSDILIGSGIPIPGIRNSRRGRRGHRPTRILWHSSSRRRASWQRREPGRGSDHGRVRWLVSQRDECGFRDISELHGHVVICVVRMNRAADVGRGFGGCFYGAVAVCNTVRDMTLDDGCVRLTS